MKDDNEPTFESTYEPRFGDYHVEIRLIGGETDIDAHLNWLRETATLAGIEVREKKSCLNGGDVLVSLSAHFMAASPVDAMFMGMGLTLPRSLDGIEFSGLIVDKHP